MKAKWTLVTTIGLLLTAPLRADVVSFPAGNFEGGNAANWTPESTGGGVASTPTVSGNTVGRIAVTGTGSGSLSTSVQSPFVASSLYVLSVDVKATSLAGVSTQIGVTVTDGNGNVIKQISQDQIVNALGINLGVVSSLTSDLTGLLGKVDLTTKLQNLLSLLNGNSAALNAIQQLVNSLVGANSSTLSAVTTLLQNVLNGTVDPSTLTSLDLANLLGVAQASPIVADLQSVLNTVTGNPGVISALQNLVNTLVAAPADTSLVDNLLTTLVGEDGLVGSVTDILAYAVSDPGLLSTLTNTLTQSLLGVTSGGSSFQQVKLIFSTGSTPPSGAIGIKLSSGATLAVGQTVDFDNVTLDRFDLGTGITPTNPVNGVVANVAPTLTVKGKQVRRNAASRQVIRGSAVANGTQNSIVRVEYRVGGPGAVAKTRKYHNAKGTTSFQIVVKPTKNARVFIRAIDAKGQVSETKRVFIYPKG